MLYIYAPTTYFKTTVEWSGKGKKYINLEKICEKKLE